MAAAMPKTKAYVYCILKYKLVIQLQDWIDKHVVPSMKNAEYMHTQYMKLAMVVSA